MLAWFIQRAMAVYSCGGEWRFNEEKTADLWAGGEVAFEYGTDGDFLIMKASGDRLVWSGNSRADVAAMLGCTVDFLYTFEQVIRFAWRGRVRGDYETDLTKYAYVGHTPISNGIEHTGDPIAPGSIRYIRNLKRLASDPIIGRVYFLCSGGEVVYVGQTTAPWPNRIANHKDKDFDDVFYIEVDHEIIMTVERDFIRTLNPKYNKGTQ